MTDREIEERLHVLVKSERKITGEILELIREAEKRRIHVVRGYSSIFEWLVGEFGYSQSTAYRRMQAARLMRDVPEVAQKVGEGNLNLTVLAKVQSAIQFQERRAGAKISTSIKRELLVKVENKPAIEAEREIFKAFPSHINNQNSLRLVGPSHSRLTLVLEEESVAKLKRVKALISHSCQTWTEVITYLAKDYLRRKDPLEKITRR